MHSRMQHCQSLCVAWLMAMQVAVTVESAIPDVRQQLAALQAQLSEVAGDVFVPPVSRSCTRHLNVGFGIRGWKLQRRDWQRQEVSQAYALVPQLCDRATVSSQAASLQGMQQWPSLCPRMVKAKATSWCKCQLVRHEGEGAAHVQTTSVISIHHEHIVLCTFSALNIAVTLSSADHTRIPS